MVMKFNVVLVPFPFDDFTSLKVRPALCLTDELGEFDHLIIAFISSKIPSTSLESDLIVLTNSSSAIGTGLITDSVIRLHKVVTIPKNLIKRKLGTLSEELITEVKLKIKQLYQV